MIKYLEKYESKYIIFDDFIDIVKLKYSKNREDLKNLFDSIIGNNNDNEIEFKHLQNLAKELGENIINDKLNNIIKYSGNNGKINFEEFYNIMSK